MLTSRTTPTFLACPLKLLKYSIPPFHSIKSSANVITTFSVHITSTHLTPPIYHPLSACTRFSMLFRSPIFLSNTCTPTPLPVHPLCHNHLLCPHYTHSSDYQTHPLTLSSIIRLHWFLAVQKPQLFHYISVPPHLLFKFSLYLIFNVEQSSLHPCTHLHFCVSRAFYENLTKCCQFLYQTFHPFFLLLLELIGSRLVDYPPNCCQFLYQTIHPFL